VRFFTILLDPDGQGMPDDVCRSYEAMPRRRGLDFEWHSFENAAVLTAWDDTYGDPLVMKYGSHLAAGMVRLDNRADLERWAECKGEKLTDLELVLRVVARYGTRYIPQILGDFGFVVWDSTKCTAVAACDAFAVQRLYYAKRAGRIAFACRAEPLALEDRYSIEHLVRLVSLADPAPGLSVYAGVHQVPAGSTAMVTRGSVTIQPYWQAADFERESLSEASESQAIEACRDLLISSIRARLGPAGQTWAQLSGGMDSSTVVSLVQWLAIRGDADSLAGTVTFVDRQGTGTDERAYSDAVASRWSVCNETIVEPPTWYDERYAPQYTDQPAFDLHVYPRDRRLCELVQAAGGRVLLTGCGGDELFTGSMLFFADWIAQGRVWQALREMARRSAIGRVSFWELAYKNALLPLLPRCLQERLVHETDEAPAQPWLIEGMLRRHGLVRRSAALPEYAGSLGSKYRHAIVSRAATLPNVTHQSTIADRLDVRHPFLYRPLVEFAIRLSPELRARPHAHRWVLREAMRGILPEVVRTRVGKTETAAALVHSLVAERGRLAPLLQDPLLAELGIVDPAKLRAAFDATAYATSRREWMHAPVISTLALEAWLQMRSGRWPRGGQPDSKEALSKVYQPST
jgi:asparagine synthase (glutamine-hydrolysing)